MRVIDLTHTIREDMPVYPGSESPTFEPVASYEKNGFRETKIVLYTHTGTHIDSPAHIFPGRITLDRFPPEQFAGKALVVDCRTCEEGGAITMEYLRPYGESVRQADFLLFASGWDRFWGTERYFEGYPCLDEEVLDFVIRGSYKGIGLDMISLDPVADEQVTRHRRLFQNRDIINIENLTDLGRCGREPFWFGCFPIKAEDSDGAPARAFAWLR